MFWGMSEMYSFDFLVVSSDVLNLVALLLA